ncbi:FAD-dependent monooxygenase fsr3 [Fusarium oxysporum f. sp. cubense]|uniref:FAD-dependent monooxygenase fsr3 n=1 Tax=Fusarium oxysporum f. sp. cubense TaxID=61366 RepID=A0A559LLL5_FUSOC|nr:FAD-dependent monooxygenase fsr3 [Fusarium oxysporum f. sp. cubense]
MALPTEDPLNKAAPNGVSVLIAGAGIAGLLCGLECYRNGMDVTLLEREPSSSPAGDFVVIGPSAKRIIQKNWPGWAKEWEKLQWNAEISYFKHSGEPVVGGFPFPKATGHLFLRPEIHKMMIAEAKRLDIKIVFNAKVVDYFEDEAKGGVELSDGRTLTADVVVAADGVHSKSWKLVLGDKPDQRSSGYSAYRTCYPAEIALKDPLVKKWWGPSIEAGKEVFQFFLGPDTHANILFGRDTVCWSVFHKDSNDTSEENWNAHLNADAAIAEFKKVAGWSPTILALVNTTPPGGVNDYRMMWRNPQAVQASPLGRVIQIGDACHTFLPTSANGAVQAMEDGASLAACLRLGGKEKIQLATKVHSLLRFQRVSCAQLMGFMNRQTLHHADWDAIKNDPIRIRRGPGWWIGSHDPEQYALDNFEAAASHITNKTPFENTNMPDDYQYKPWNIDEIEAEMRKPGFKPNEVFMDNGVLD